ncbi:MAG: hypothetical protein ONB30_02975 [candidate division KSB1 bacterium]|nr:hypothetical protein [candidate division KSB1 bacterium]MDZ7337487.1 hypothetical protein [candidate division KSB1 bacterium]MDZ7378888.1 hypothetical protein [candidate division KSB1 bacterium]MDZ7386209.1 hypothetical protein [candidate division KSB1 bacterium]MDZ7391742.1 hypothetical protein [candidate division KSB1 bacterium]
MRELDNEKAGWVVALSWLTALEETARDFHGTRPRTFCERAYEHAVDNYLSTLENDYGFVVPKSDSIKSALDNYIQIGVRAKLFRDASQLELKEVNPNRVEVTVHLCPYVKSCKELLASGATLRDLTCARIGAFRAAVKYLANIDCSYSVTAFDVEDTCHGVIERK